MLKNKALKKAVDFWLKAAEDNFQAGKVMLQAGQYSLAMLQRRR